VGRREALIALLDEALVVLALAGALLYAAYAAGLVSAAGAIAVMALLVAGLGVVVWRVAEAQSRREAVGPEALVGAVGVALDDLDPEGMVLVEGEIWRARSPVRVRRGERIRVVSYSGLLLHVEPVGSSGGMRVRRR